MNLVPSRRARLVVCFATLLLASTACAQSPPPHAKASIDPALVKEQQRRIAAFDSVVRGVNTDSAYKLWHVILTSPDPRASQILVMCEYSRLSSMYGRAAHDAIDRMRDTLWRNDDPALVQRMSHGMEGMSPVMRRNTCGPPPSIRASRWLVEWTVYELPKLPPSPDSAASEP